MSEHQIPPGLDGILEHYTSGGADADWLPLLPIKYYTNAYIVKGDKVLLGYKKRGFGQGQYSGFGGKVEPNETSPQAALRELEEEAGIRAPLKHIGVLLFLTSGAEKAFYIDIYYAEEYEGTISETDEMRPEWFSFSASKDNEELRPVPLDNMWGTDRYWIPLLQDRQPFVGRADFDQDENGVYRPRRWWYGKSSG